jgi:hypothetical protein
MNEQTIGSIVIFLRQTENHWFSNVKSMSHHFLWVYWLRINLKNGGVWKQVWYIQIHPLGSNRESMHHATTKKRRLKYVRLQDMLMWSLDLCLHLLWVIVAVANTSYNQWASLSQLSTSFLQRLSLQPGGLVNFLTSTRLKRKLKMLLITNGYYQYWTRKPLYLSLIAATKFAVQVKQSLVAEFHTHLQICADFHYKGQRCSNFPYGFGVGLGSTIRFWCGYIKGTKSGEAIVGATITYR